VNGWLEGAVTFAEQDRYTRNGLMLIAGGIDRRVHAVRDKNVLDAVVVHISDGCGERTATNGDGLRSDEPLISLGERCSRGQQA
jgi:hypothetical protein